ncbi:MAG: ADP-heptose:LPS heptosyltransferase [Motiliproteus sp.]|jgi:ADP-heptose:LPS heptosyltransferase
MKLWFERGAYASKKGRRIAAELEPEKVKNIAVIRHAALGDMVITRAFLQEARRFFPNAQITLSLVSNYTYSAPEDLVDRVHVIHGSDQRGTPIRERIARIKELGEQDIIFDLAATNRSYYVCLFNKAKLKLGFPYKPIQNRIFYDLGILRSDFKFEAETMLDFLNLLGHQPRYPLEFGYPRYDAASCQPRVVYFFGASTANKCYPQAQMIEVIDRLATSAPEHQHVILEGIKPHEKADKIIAQLKHHTNVSVQTQLSLEEVIPWLAESKLLVCNDTGVRNLAIATHTPTLGLFFSTVPYRYWPRYEPHYAVFNADGSLPTVEAVSQEILHALGLGTPAPTLTPAPIPAPTEA